MPFPPDGVEPEMLAGFPALQNTVVPGAVRELEEIKSVTVTASCCESREEQLVGDILIVFTFNVADESRGEDVSVMALPVPNMERPAAVAPRYS